MHISILVSVGMHYHISSLPGCNTAARKLTCDMVFLTMLHSVYHCDWGTAVVAATIAKIKKN